jgi:hypothetical protein
VSRCSRIGAACLGCYVGVNVSPLKIDVIPDQGLTRSLPIDAGRARDKIRAGSSGKHRGPRPRPPSGIG